jgi:hypothetical protein
LSDASVKDRSIFVSFGLVLSLKIGDIDKVRSWLETNGVKIVFQTSGGSDLFVLREYQVRRILQGDISQLREIYQKKQRRVEK